MTRCWTGVGAWLGQSSAVSLAFPVMPGMASARFVIGLVGFLAGLLACVLLAVVEYGAWALVAPPRVREKDDGPNEGAGELTGRPWSISVVAESSIEKAVTSATGRSSPYVSGNGSPAGKPRPCGKLMA